MSVEAIAKAVQSRHVELRDWGKVMLEEVLFRAAEAVSAGGDRPDSVTIALEFRLTADPARGILEIATGGAVEGSIFTTLSMNSG